MALARVLRRHGPLIPLYLCVSAGAFGAAAFSIRTALYNPDVQWKRTGVISNEEFREKQYKFYSSSPEASKIQCLAPRYDNFMS